MTRERNEAEADLEAVRVQRDAATARVTELEGLLAEATKPADDATPPKPAKK